MAALGFGAPAWAVLGLSVLVFAVHIYSQERKASWDRADLRNQFDQAVLNGRRDRDTLSKRLEAKQRAEEPTLFDLDNEEHDDGHDAD